MTHVPEMVGESDTTSTTTVMKQLHRSEGYCKA